MRKILSLLANKWSTIFRTTTVTDRVTSFYYSTNITRYNYKNDSGISESFSFLKNNGELRTIWHKPKVNNLNPEVITYPDRYREAYANNNIHNYREVTRNYFIWPNSSQHPRVINDPALCNATITNDKTKAWSDYDAIRPFASFSFSLAADVYSNAASARKESYHIQPAKTFLFSHKAYNIRSAEYNKPQLLTQVIAGVKKNSFDGNKL